MKLAQFFARSDASRIAREAAELQPDKPQEPLVAAYLGAIAEIAGIEPAAPTDMSLFLSPYFDEDGETVLFVSVCGIRGGHGNQYDLRFVPWEHWLAMDVRLHRGVTLDRDAMMAKILFEMTWEGFSRKAIAEKAAADGEQVVLPADMLTDDEMVMEGLAQLDRGETVSWEEAMAGVEEILKRPPRQHAESDAGTQAAGMKP